MATLYTGDISFEVSPTEQTGLSGLADRALINRMTGGKVPMGHLIVVRATWDSEAKVWVAESSDLPGLATEAESLDVLERKLPGLIQDLLDGDDDGQELEIPVEIVASFSSRVRVRARAA